MTDAPRTVADEEAPESLMPAPVAWPQCSECETAYVLRRGWVFSKGWMWIWQQDCKHGRKGSPQPDAVIAHRDEQA